VAWYRKLTLSGVIVAGMAVAAAADDITGVYRGTIWSADDNPGMTIFSVSGLGEISGTYVYETSSGSATGDLRECAFDVRLLRCTWHDEFGAGDFIVLFDPDYKSFDGSWFEDRRKNTRMPDSGYRWTGKSTE